MRRVTTLCAITLLCCCFAGLLEGQTVPATPEDQTVEVIEGEVVSELAAPSQPSPKEPAGTDVISIDTVRGRILVTTGQSKLITMPRDVSRVSNTAPATATVQVISQREILLDGKKPGITTMIIWDVTGKTHTYNVTVQRDVELLRERLQQIDEGIGIEVHPAQDSVILFGVVDSPAKITKAITVAAAFFEDTDLYVLAGPGGTIVSEGYRPKPLKFAGVGGGTAVGERGTISFEEVSRVWNAGEGAIISTKNGKVISFLKLKEPLQVELQVRFVQVDLSLLKELGFDSSLEIFFDAERTDPRTGFISNTTGVPFNVNPDAASPSGVIRYFLIHRTDHLLFRSQLRALEDRQVIKTLSEPNLSVISGQEATFLVGGEFPFLVPQRTVSVAGEPFFTVEWKVFGNKLELVPEVKEDGIINLKLSPEVSERSPELGIDFPISGQRLRIPGLTTRRAETTVEMEDGESLVIAGLVSEKERDIRTQVPLLGDVPVLGELFRKRRKQSDRTELMIVVTPRLVRPMSAKEAEEITLSGMFRKETVRDKFLEKRFEASKWLSGPFGFQ